MDQEMKDALELAMMKVGMMLDPALDIVLTRLQGQRLRWISSRLPAISGAEQRIGERRRDRIVRYAVARDSSKRKTDERK